MDGGQRRPALSDRSDLTYDALLSTAGRRARVDGMGLDAAGVGFRAVGLEADDHLRTTNPAVCVAGMWSGRRSTPTWRSRWPSWRWPTPWTGPGGRCRTWSSPTTPTLTRKVSQVEITPGGAAERGLALDIHRLELAKVERAMIDGEADGFAALYTHNGVIGRGGPRG